MNDMELKKYRYIDCLRGIAIMLVVLVHCSLHFDTTNLPAKLITFFENGRFGVSLFFIISSYTLMLSLHSRKDESKSIRNFYIRRFFRIAPVFYLAIVYYSFEQFLGFDVENLKYTISTFPFSNLILSIFFVNGFHPSSINSFVPGGWSIAVEMSFYVVLPLIFKYINSLSKSILFLTISLLLSSMFRIVLFKLIAPEMSNGFIYYNFINQLPNFGLGIFIYFITKSTNDSLTSRDFALLTMIVLFFIYFAAPEYLIHSILFVLLVLLMRKKRIPIFENNGFEWIGKLSFSIYLSHFAILYWFDKFFKFPEINDISLKIILFFVYYLIILIASAFISYFSYTFIELKGQELGKKIINKSYD